MDHLPASWTALCVLAFALGTRHGLDADHLATIDGLTRYNACANPRLARRAGALFSLGHGGVVILVALLAATVYRGWQTPEWLELTGAAISIAFLFGIAYMNVRAVLCTHPDHVVAPVGFKGRLLSRFVTVQRSWAIAAVGMLFALSFDTISQAALFALAAGRFGGVGNALAVAALFVLGMLAIDGINGMWISRLIRRADRTAVVASRLMALTVAGISIVVGLLCVAKVLAPALDGWANRHALAISATVTAAIVVGFAATVITARRRGTMLPA